MKKTDNGGRSQSLSWNDSHWLAPSLPHRHRQWLHKHVNALSFWNANNHEQTKDDTQTSSIHPKWMQSHSWQRKWQSMNAHSTHTQTQKQKEQKKLSGKDSRHKGQTINQKKNQSSSLGLVIRKFFVNGLCVSVKEEKEKHSKTNGHAAPTNKVLRKRRKKAVQRRNERIDQRRMKRSTQRKLMTRVPQILFMLYIHSNAS